MTIFRRYNVPGWHVFSTIFRFFQFPHLWPGFLPKLSNLQLQSFACVLNHEKPPGTCFRFLSKPLEISAAYISICMWSGLELWSGLCPLAIYCRTEFFFSHPFCFRSIIRASSKKIFTYLFPQIWVKSPWRMATPKNDDQPKTFPV